MYIHHMSITANLTIYLAFPAQKAAHRVVDHTWFDQVACWPLTQLGHAAAHCLQSHELASIAVGALFMS